MEIDELIRGANNGEVPAAVVLTGAERFLCDRAMQALRAATVDEGMAGFNEDLFIGKQVTGKQIIAAARTLPMMSRRRFVLVREAEQLSADAQAELAEYLHAPSPETCLVLMSDKLPPRSKLVTAAKTLGLLAEAKELKGGAARQFAEAEARTRGHKLEPDAAAALMDAIGTDLSQLDDALERLSLYVGEAAPITLAAVEACVVRIRTESIWTLVDAVSQQNARKAMAAATSLLADRQSPLSILALVARQLRQVAKMREALSRGLGAPEAAKEAGTPPFKAAAMADAARRFSGPTLTHAFQAIAHADQAMKGSKVPADRVLEETLLTLCTRPGAAQDARR